MNYKDTQEKITNKAIKKQVKLIKKTIKAQEDKLIEQITHLATVSFADTTYRHAIKNVMVVDSCIDYGCLNDILIDYELNDSASCLVNVDITFNNNVKANINAWVTVEDDMTFLNGDFRIASENFEIDHDGLNPRERTFVSDCLDTLAQVDDNQGC